MTENFREPGEFGDGVTVRRPRSAVDELICTVDPITLIGLVGKLTGGNFNPKVVESHIERVRNEHDTE